MKLLVLTTCRKYVKDNLVLLLSLIATAIWTANFLNWHFISMKTGILSLNASGHLSTISQKIVQVPLFVKIIFYLLILFTHTLIIKYPDLKKSKRLLLNCYSIIAAILFILFGCQFIISPIQQYKTTVYQSLK